MKEIQLSKGRTALVDDNDFDFLNQYQWSYTKNGTGEYAEMCIWDSENKNHVNVYMHKLILNTPRGMCVDHIDHNGLNNQRSRDYNPLSCHKYIKKFCYLQNNYYLCKRYEKD